MRNDRLHWKWMRVLSAWVLLTQASRADELVFTTPDTRLSGTVTAIGAHGEISILTPHTPQPLQLAAGAVRRIGFPGPGAGSSPAIAAAVETGSRLMRVQLANRDVLPVVIDTLDATRLVAVSPDAGRLEIPRDQILALFPAGVAAPVFYAGPTAEGWRHISQGGSKWEFEGHECSASDSAVIARNLPDLPDAFVVRFHLSWEHQPNFQLHFADPLLPAGQPADRYLFRITPAGIDLKRECSSGRRYRDIAILNHLPSAYPDSVLRIEIRVDRGGQKLEILLNGESEGVFPDGAAPLPRGNGLVLVSNAGTGDRLRVSCMEVLGAGGAAALAAPPQERVERDVLTTVEEEQWRGTLEGIQAGKDGPVVVFKPDAAQQAMEIPLAELAWTAMAAATPEAGPGAAATQDPPRIRLRLHGGAELSAAACQFDGQSLVTHHPLLGPLAIPKARLAEVEFQPASSP